jgi:hypothetical protein
VRFGFLKRKEIAMNTKMVNGAVVSEIEVDPTKTNEQLEGESHVYSLKGVKTFRGMDGQGLNATLMRGDKKVAFILDEGCGGEMRFDFVDRLHGNSSEEDLWDAFIAAEKLKTDDTKLDEYGHTERFYFDGATWVNKKVDDLLNEKRFRKMCKTKTLFQVGDEIGSGQFMALKGVDLATRQYIEKKYKGQKIRILNDEYKD